jgi:hypothetical protein
MRNEIIPHDVIRSCADGPDYEENLEVIWEDFT